MIKMVFEIGHFWAPAAPLNLESTYRDAWTHVKRYTKYNVDSVIRGPTRLEKLPFSKTIFIIMFLLK